MAPSGRRFAQDEPTRDEPIGAAWLREFTGANPGHGFIDESIPEIVIAVLPAHTRRGIGLALLQQLLVAASQKYRGVSLNVRQSSPAVRPYERLDFRKVPGNEFVNRVGSISIVMELAFGA